MNKIFKGSYTAQFLQDISKKTMVAHLGIEFLEVGDDFITARMPVDARTHQPLGLLHGGASVVLAETIGSTASSLCLDPESGQVPVGLEINANHLRSVRSGWVYGKATPINIGRNIHVWDIKITDEGGKMVCISRLTTMIIAAASKV